jgi:hypothetical protein
MRTLGNKSKLTALSAVPFFVGAIALAVGAFIQPAAATPPTGGGSAGNSNNKFAVGAVTPTNGFCALGHVAFAAQQNPTKTTPTYAGHVEQQSAAGSTAGGKVICVGFDTDMTGMPNYARVVWHVDHSNDVNTPADTFRQFDVTDMGPPVGGMPPDTFSDRGECSTASNCDTQDNPTPCCDCTAMMADGPVLNGNIEVKD